MMGWPICQQLHANSPAYGALPVVLRVIEVRREDGASGDVFSGRDRHLL